MELHPFTRAAALAVLIGNDFWYMHLYAKDKDFDKSHRLTGDYYDRLGWESDDLMELSIEVGAEVFNPSEVGKWLPEYTPESDKAYSYGTIVTKAQEKLRLYLTALKDMRDSTSRTDIQSRLDECLRYWEKELNYKLAARAGQAGVPSMLVGFVNSGLDNELAYKFAE